MTTLPEIDSSTLQPGMVISYRYGKLDTVFGPFKVKLVSRDHNGPYAILIKDRDDRRISLADDEDYGSLHIYRNS